MAEPANYVLRNFGEVFEIERLLQAARKRPNPGWCEEREAAGKLADAVSRRLFGVCQRETIHKDNPDLTREQNDQAWGGWEPRIRNGPSIEGKAAAVIEDFDDWGWDVSDGSGGVLRCLPMFNRQIIAATEGIVGRLPHDDVTRDDEQTIEAQLKAEADKFRRGR